VSLTRIYPVPPDGADESVDLQSPDSRDRLARLYATPRRTWLRLNFVTTIAGNAAGADGTSDALSSRTDRAVLGVIRRLSDVVLVGASSVRAEGYRLPRAAPLAVITSSGNLTGLRVPTQVDPGRLFVLCARAAVEAVRSQLPPAVEVIPIPAEAGVIPIGSALAALRERGLANIVCEGGPSLAAQLVNAGLVDELCLTTSPILDQLRLTLLPGVIQARRLSLAQLLVDESDALYARWLFPERSTTA
jgi:riboflavin biosynthesis pyrimidine reductase